MDIKLSVKHFISEM